MKRFLAIFVVLALVFGGVSGCAWFKKTVCENQAMADDVKAKATTVMATAKVTVAELKAELALATDIGVQAQITLALAAAEAVMNLAYSLIYEKICPVLADLENLTQQDTVAKQLTARSKMAVAKAKKR